MSVYKQNQIKKVDISLKQLSDLDTTNALYSDRLDNIRDNQILISGTNQFRKDVFRFKYLTDLIQAGTGVTITNSNGILTISSTGGGGGGVTSIDVDGGTGISVSPAGPITTSGTFTVTNTAPDQTVVLNNGTGISVTGTYPNFTITNTGSTPSLQQVTAVGYETTDAIITKNVFGFQVKTSLNQLLAMLHPNGANTEGELILYNTNTLLPATTYKRAGINNMLFPTSGSGTFALSVNGVTPNATTGDITLSVGGGGLKYGVATGTNTYAVTITGVTSYTDGDTYAVKFTNGNDDDSTININGLGVKTLVKQADIQVTGGDIVSGQELIIIYDGTNFQCIGVAPNQLFAYVTNDDSVTITKGQPVYAFSAAGNRMSVKLASNTADATSAQTVGVVFSSSIAAGQKGFIITQGVISGLNTSAYSAGAQLYLGSTAGTMTSTKPYAPNHLVYIGIVERANAGNGQIYIKPQNGYELEEIHDVDLISVTPVNNDVLTYVTGSPDLWKPRSLTSILGYTPLSAAITSLNGLTVATQTFATPGTTGTAPNWSSATSTHTLNIPLASAAGVTAGLISKTDYDTFTSKPSTDTMVFASAPNSSHTNINGNTAFWAITGSGAIRSTENAAIVVMPYAGTLKNFYVRLGASASSGGSIVLTVRVNGSNTALTLTFTNADGSNITKSDTTNSVSVSVGDRVTIGGTNNAGSQAGTVVSTVLTLERS